MSVDFSEEIVAQEPIPRKYGMLITTCSYIVFSTFSSVIVSRYNPRSVDPKQLWKWRNLFVSWVHALIVGTWDLVCFVRYPELTSDLVSYHNFFLYALVAVSTGYFLHDTVDIVSNGNAAVLWEVLLHHAGVVSVFIYNLWFTHCIAYTNVALMAEMSSIFLHARKLMQMMHVPFSHPVYRANVYVNLVMFVIGRFVALSWIVLGMVRFHERIGERYMILLSVTIFVMWIINLILFKRLLISDILRRSRTKIAELSNGRHSDQCDDNDNSHKFVNGYKTQ